MDFTECTLINIKTRISLNKSVVFKIKSIIFAFKHIMRMKRRIYTFLFAIALLSFALPTTIKAETSLEMIEQDIHNISISVYGSVLRIEGANDEMLQIYNVTGVCVMSLRVDGQDKRYNLNLPKGCYIVKVGKVVRKISIR